VLAHSDHPSVQLMAVLDVVINNADRKVGHVLHATDGGVYGVDHGICLHRENKLRTVLWGWRDEPLPEEGVAALNRLRTALDGELAGELGKHITRAELRALRNRTENLLRVGVFPAPTTEWRAIPWPAF